MNDHIPNLTMSIDDDGNVFLNQDNGGNSHSIDLHPTQLRYLAEKAGLVESSDITAQKTIASLKRKLLVLRDRINDLGSYMSMCSDTDHANLEHEISLLDAMTTIANEFCAELD